MKNSALLIAFIFILPTQSQSQCCPKRTLSVHGFYQTNKTAGIEAGMWPVNTTFGLFGGAMVNIVEIKEYDSFQKKDVYYNYISPIVYIKGQTRLHRFAHITASTGLIDLNKLYTSAGFRFSIPIDRGKRATTVIEPQITTLGFRTSLGIAYSLEK